MMQTNNPVLALAQLAKTGGDPMQMLRQMAGQDPRMKTFFQMVNGKNPQQLRQMAENMCRERGTTVDDVARQLGLM